MHNHAHEAPAKTSMGTHRLEALQDGVFAIVMTLLVLEFKIPEVSTSASLLEYVEHLWPILLSYVVTFVNLGIHWVGQNNQFYFIKAADRILLWINLCFLMLIALLPYTTALLGRYPLWPLPYALYGINLILIGLTAFWQWCYATKHHRLTSHDLSSKIVKRTKFRILLAPVVCLVAIACSFYDTRLSLLFYVILPPYYIWPGKVDHFWRMPAIPHEH